MCLAGARHNELDLSYRQWLASHQTFDLGDPAPRRVRVVRLFFLAVYGLPTIVWVGLVVPFFTSVLGRDRAPWIMAKCLQFYRQFVFGVLYPVASRVAGRSGFH